MNDESPQDALPTDRDDRTERFVALFGSAQPHVHAQILTLLPHWADADDVLQRTNIILWRKFGEWRAEQDFTLWACGIARFEVKNFLRVQARDRHRFNDELLEALASTAVTVAEHTDVGAQIEALRKCVRKLRPTDRQIIDGCYGENSVAAKDVAARLGRPANTVYKALSRIRQRLFKCIQQAMGKEVRP